MVRREYTPEDEYGRQEAARRRSESEAMASQQAGRLERISENFSLLAQMGFPGAITLETVVHHPKKFKLFMVKALDRGIKDISRYYTREMTGTSQGYFLEKVYYTSSTVNWGGSADTGSYNDISIDTHGRLAQVSGNLLDTRGCLIVGPSFGTVESEAQSLNIYMVEQKIAALLQTQSGS